MDHTPSELTAKIFAEVRRKKILQKELSFRTGINRPLLSSYQSGRHQMSVQRAETIAKAMGYRLVLQPLGE